MGLVTRSKAAFRKTYPDVRALLTRQYPDFVYGAGNATSASLPVPVFCFHAVEPESFEAYLIYLNDNGYRAIDTTEWLDEIENPSCVASNKVLLTFDDGDVTLYHTAYPLLRKYDFKAVSFICPGLIPANHDQGQGKRDRMLCNWSEICEMHDSGVIDFQCHSFNHDLVFISDDMLGFLSPDFKSPFFGKADHPIVIDDAVDLSLTNLCSFRSQTAAGHWGAPVYSHKPRMAAEQRYLSSGRLRQHLTEFVKENGNAAFFQRDGWEKILKEQAARDSDDGELIQGQAYQGHVVRELERSIAAIEAELPGKKVTHLCPPWFVASESALRTAEAVGFRAAFLGVEQRGGVAESGEMHRVQRLAYKYITRLPGKNRTSLLTTFLDRSG